LSVNQAAALQTAQKIEWSWSKAKALGAIAQAQAAAGQWEESQETFSIALETPGLFEEEVQVNVLCTRAVVEAARDKAAALETFRELLEFAQESGKQRDNYLSTIAATQAKAGEIATALKITDEIEDGREQVRALLAIAWEQFKKGEKEMLLTTVAIAFQAKDKIKDEQKRLQALRELAQIQAMAGKGEDAVRTVDALLTERNLSLPCIASWLIETGDRTNFKKLLIPCAYYIDATYQMCGYLAHLYPEKAEEIAKVISELN
jgi:tetratricopeptide (TPR) repeat protein